MQAVMASEGTGLMWSPIVTTSNRRKSSVFSYAFTEQGVALLSAIGNSDIAINMNIFIMRAFVAIRKIAFSQHNVQDQLIAIKKRLGEHDVQLNQVYKALENLLNKTATQIKWNERQRIGFRP